MKTHDGIVTILAGTAVSACGACLHTKHPKTANFLTGYGLAHLAIGALLFAKQEYPKLTTYAQIPLGKLELTL